MRLLFSVVMLFGAALAHGTVTTLVKHPLFTNTFQPIRSEVDSQEIADDFLVLSPTLLTAASWYGFYPSHDLDPSLSSIDFVIRLYADKGGEPDASPFFDKAVSAAVEDTGRIARAADAFGGGVIGDGTIYQFRAELPTPVDLSASGPYWVAILEADARTTQAGHGFLWATSDPSIGEKLAFRIASGSPAGSVCGMACAWSVQTGGALFNKVAFSLYGVVPESASWLLVLIGCAILLVKSWLQKMNSLPLLAINLSRRSGPVETQ